MANKAFLVKAESLSDVFSFCRKILVSFACLTKIQMEICLAIEEVFVNVVRYAYPDFEGDITLSAEERKIGGLGIFISKKTMDSVIYDYKNNENVLTMIKKI